MGLKIGTKVFWNEYGTKERRKNETIVASESDKTEFYISLNNSSMAPPLHNHLFLLYGTQCKKMTASFKIGDESTNTMEC